METKVIYFETNFNNKLHCAGMVHIDLAPMQKISNREKEQRMNTTVYEIRTKDNSYPPSQWRMVDLFECELHQLTGICTMPSHGMDQADFWQDAKSRNMTGATRMAVYYYQRYKQ